LLGEANSALLLNCATLEHQVVAVPENAVFLVLDSGTSRQLENTGYGQRRLELEQALDRMGVASAKELSLTELDSLDPLSRRRLRHVITENERVGQFAAALSAGDLREAGRLISESHASLRDDYEVSTPQLDELARIAEECGAYGARLLGGGFGGAVLCLVEAETAAEVGAAVVKAFGSKRPPIIARPSRGAHVLTSSAVR
jgi:galactokinase